jgi:glucose-1-phosphate cytidylyltransferase
MCQGNQLLRQTHLKDSTFSHNGLSQAYGAVFKFQRTSQPYMKVILLAGGLGTRLSEETSIRPKPMVEIGGRPMLWHIMNIYAQHGFTDFLIACGYKGEVIKEYFHNFLFHNSDLLIHLKSGDCQILDSAAPDWRVGVIDTGPDTLTGGRILRLQHIVGNETFMVTYGDGVSNVDIGRLLDFHRAHGKVATITAVSPIARFGLLELDGDRVRSFQEKPQTMNDWINGGFFVFEPEVFDYISGDRISLEGEPLQRLAADDQLMAYRHDGFWHPMDTLRDKTYLESLWASGQAPWRTA